MTASPPLGAFEAPSVGNSLDGFACAGHGQPAGRAATAGRRFQRFRRSELPLYRALVSAVHVTLLPRPIYVYREAPRMAPPAIFV